MKNGVIDLHGHDWLIECEPHVHIRFKRVFQGVSKYSPRGVIRISDTLQNCREIAWFLSRYPMECKESTYLAERAEAFDAQLALIDRIVTQGILTHEIALAVPAREYQKIAGELVLARKSLLLADEVGLGKTVVAFCMMTEPSTRPAIVVTLTHLPLQWQEMLGRFAPDLRSYVIKRGSPSYSDKAGKQRSVELAAVLESGAPVPDVIILSYSKLINWAPLLKGIAKSVTFDEIQELRSGPKTRSGGSSRYDAAEDLASACAYRLGLSATPIYNYGGEIYNVLNTLDPGLLGSRDEFSREWCIGAPGGKTALANPAAFGSHLRECGALLRRTAIEVGRELPKTETIIHHVSADLDEFAKIEATAVDLAKIILETSHTNVEKLQAAGDLDWRLRRATGVAKAPYVAEFVRMLLESGERVVVYGWHRDVYEIWKERLAYFNPVFFTGSESTVAKEAAKQKFCSGDARVLVISLRAGAGLDGLQHHARIVVFGELDWSPQVLEQNIGRLNRDGQKSEVLAYYLLTDHGSDPIIADVLGLKKAQSDGILRPDAPLVAALQQTGSNVKRLATEYLKQRGVTIMAQPVDATVQEELVS